MFPRIERPCPFKANLAAVMDGDFCRACQRQVFDLSALDEGERRAFLAGCEGEVCVSYRVPRPVVAAAALAAAAFVPTAAMAAQEVTVNQSIIEASAVPEDYDYSQEIIVGGVGAIHDPDAGKGAAAEPAPAEDLPVTYEDEAEQPAATR